MSKSLVGLDFLSMGIALRNAFFCSAESIIIADKPPHSKKRSGFIPGTLLLSFFDVFGLRTWIFCPCNVFSGYNV